MIGVLSVSIYGRQSPQLCSSPGAQELGALLGAEVFDFTGLRWTERVHALAAAQVWGTAERDRRPVR